MLFCVVVSAAGSVLYSGSSFGTADDLNISVCLFVQGVIVGRTSSFITSILCSNTRTSIKINLILVHISDVNNL